MVDVSTDETITILLVMLAWWMLLLGRGELSPGEFKMGAGILAFITLGFLVGRVLERRAG
ncbi:MAG: hypothetical protein ABEH65_07050 [Halobacteriales archaeon]